MTRQARLYCPPRLIFGLMLVLLGVVFTLDKLDVINVGHYWRFWPVFLIGAGLGKVMQPAGSAGRGFGFALLLVGGWLLLYNLGLVDYNIWDLWPVLLVLLGAGMVWRAMGGRSSESGPPLVPGDGVAPLVGGLSEPPPPPSVGAGSGGDTVHAMALFGGVSRKSVSQDFRGGDLTAALGAVNLDLRSASIASGPAVVDVFAFWGGIEVKVPQDWQVSVEGTPILGGIDDKTMHAQGGTGKHLIVRGIALMGGVEIRN